MQIPTTKENSSICSDAQVQVSRSESKPFQKPDGEASENSSVQLVAQSFSCVLPEQARPTSHDGQSVTTPVADADSCGNPGGGPQPSDTGRTAHRSDQFWSEAPRPELPGNMEGPRVGILDGEPLWSQHQDISPSLHAICRVEAGSPRSPAAADPSCSTRQPAHDFIRCQRISQVGWPKPQG